MSFTRLGIWVKLSTRFVAVLFLFLGSFFSIAGESPGSSGCNFKLPKDLNTLAIPAQFREQVLYWLQQIDSSGSLTGVEFIRDPKSGGLLVAGDALLVRHHGQLKLVAPSVFGDLPDERPLEGDEIVFSTKINNLYVVQTISHEGDSSSPTAYHLAILGAKNGPTVSGERRITTSSPITHNEAPYRAGELFTHDRSLIFISKLVKIAEKENPFDAAVIEARLGGDVLASEFTMLAGMPVLKIAYGKDQDAAHGEAFFTYKKGFVFLFDSKGDHQTFSVLAGKSRKRYFIVNRYVVLETGESRTQVIEAFPDLLRAEPLRDTYIGFFVVKPKGPVLQTERFMALPVAWISHGKGGKVVKNRPALLAFPDSRNFRIRKQLTADLYPQIESAKNALGTGLILEPEIIFESDKFTVYRTNLRAAQNPTDRPEGLVILHKQDERIEFQAFEKKDDRLLRTPTADWRVDLSLFSTHKVTSVQQEAQFGGDLLSVRFETKGGTPSPFVLLIDPIRHTQVIIPGFQRTLKQTFRGIDYYFIFGQIGTSDQIALTIYDTSTRSFRNVQGFNPLAGNKDQRYFPERIAFSPPTCEMPNTILGRDIAGIEIEEVSGTSWLYFDVRGGEHADGRTIRYLFDMSNPERQMALEEPRTLTLTGESEYQVMVGKIRRSGNGRVDKDFKKFDDQTTLFFLPMKVDESDFAVNNISDSAVAIVLQGQVQSLEFRHHRYVEARGTSSHMGHHDAVEYHFDMRGEGDDIHTLVNKVGEPMYEDPEGKNQIFATHGSVDSDPRLFIYEKPSESAPVGRWSEVDLSVTKTVTMKVQVLFFEFEVEDVELIPNTQRVESVRREGNFLFIKTVEGDGRPSQTFVYSLEKAEVVFSIPNLVTHFDVQGYRFYVGNSGPFNTTNVVVTKLATGEKVEIFDFGRTDIDIRDSGCIRHDKKKNAVVFKTTTGHERVYDLKKRHFYGLLPKKVAEITKEVEELGTVINRLVFEGKGQHQDALMGRDEAFRRLERQFQLAHPHAGSQYAMLIGENGTGRSLMVHEYVSRYIGGTLNPMPQRQLVFFSLDPTTVTSGTKFRGTFADKFQKLKKVATDLEKEGFRLVLLLDDMDAFQKPDWKDDEGDIFSQLKTLFKDESFDVLASATPGGHERLVRESGGLISAFHTVRVEPMTEPETFESVQRFLTRQQRPVSMDERLLRTMISRIRRLQIHKQLPGSAFDLLKRIMRSKSEHVEPDQPLVITRQDVNEHLAEQSGVPAMLFDPVERATKMPEFLAYLKRRIRNQDDAVDRVFSSILSFAEEIKRPDWPIVRAFLLGPTGVGKTELVRAVEEFLFGGDTRTLKINGPEYSGSVIDIRGLSKKIVDHIKRHPCNIILIDEFEKMHPEAQNIILGLADGEISDEGGRRVSSALTLLFATSNLGAQEASSAVSHALGFHRGVEAATAAMHAEYEKALDRDIRPEVLNRFDIVEIFTTLDEETARIIINDYLNSQEALATVSVRERLANQGIKVEFNDSVMVKAIQSYLDVRFGARRLASRAESHLVEEFLSREMLAGRLVSGKSYLIRYNEDTGRYEAIEIQELDTAAAGQ